MAENTLSSREKKETLSRIEKKIGPTRQAKSRRPDWRETPDRQTSVFITFSKTEHLYYDVGKNDLKKWQGYKRAFVVFVLGDHRKLLIVPADRLADHLYHYHKTASDGTYKLHVRHDDGYYRFTELPKLDLVNYVNAFSIVS